MTVLSRSRWRLLLVFLLLLLAGSLLLRSLALWQYDRLLTEQALHELSARGQGETPFRWWVDDAPVLDRHHDLGDFQSTKEGLSFTAAGKDPFVYLPTLRQQIPAAYNRLQLELHASEATKLQLFHKTLDRRDAILASHWIDVQPGWQTLDIPLNQQYWHILPLDGGPSEGRGRWGGASGVITDLRLDPADRAGVRITLRGLVLKASVVLPDTRQLVLTGDLPTQPAGSLVALDMRQAQAIQPWLQAHRGEPLLLADATPWRTPESAYRFRQWALAQVPQAIWFPAVPNEAVLQTLRELPESKAVLPDARWHWPDWRWPVALSALLALVVYAGIVAARLRFAGDRIVAVLAGVWIAAAVWIQAGQLSTASGVLATGSLGLAVLFWLWRQPGVWWQRLGLQKPTWAAWRETLWLSLPAAAVLAWMALSAEETVREVSYRDLLMYPLWVVIQQLFLSVWLTSLLAWSVDLPQRRAWLPIIGVLAGFVFALLHFPNYGAMAVVYLMGTGWACLWLRHRSLWPLMVSHAVLGLAFSLLMPGWLRLDGNVGAAYFAWLW